MSILFVNFVFNSLVRQNDYKVKCKKLKLKRELIVSAVLAIKALQILRDIQCFFILTVEI